MHSLQTRSPARPTKPHSRLGHWCPRWPDLLRLEILGDMQRNGLAHLVKVLETRISCTWLCLFWSRVCAESCFSKSVITRPRHCGGSRSRENQGRTLMAGYVHSIRGVAVGVATLIYVAELSSLSVKVAVACCSAHSRSLPEAHMASQDVRAVASWPEANTSVNFGACRRRPQLTRGSLYLALKPTPQTSS